MLDEREAEVLEKYAVWQQNIFNKDNLLFSADTNCGGCGNCAT